jgi:serine/threonine-protein kinase
VADIAGQLRDAIRDSYLLERELGRGGMATVYLARDVRHKRLVALKVLHPELAHTLGPERFQREIELAARLQHPHILTVFDSGEAAGQLWFTMPYVEGESLRDRLRRDGRLPVEDALRIAREAAQALQYAHDHGVIHRDIKPENLLLTTDGNTLVADFGIARVLAGTDSRLTESGLAIGTPVYMSPEQAAGDPGLDARTDVYSLGAVLYEMLTGEPPFSGATPQAVIAKRLSTPPVPPRVLRDTVPPMVDAAVLRALSRDPVDRPASAAEFARTLETSRVSVPPGEEHYSASPPSRRSRGLLLAGAGAVLLASGGLAYLLQSPPKPVDAKVVAVAPFRVSGADPSLSYLREGMVDLLAAKLGGTAGMRPADARSLLAAWRSAGGSTDADLGRGDALGVAARVGAGQLVLGDLVGSPDRVVVHATMLTVPQGTQTAEATVEGPADSLLTLVDRLAAQVLLLRAGEEQQRVASLTTTSLPALRAYLEAQAFYRRGRYADASRLYREAVALDSSFALAGLKLVHSSGWAGTPEARELGYTVASRYRQRLSERDRVLLDASSSLSGLPARFSTVEQIRAAERYTQLAPDSPDGWQLLADDMFHYGPALGLEGAHVTAQAAFERAVELDSTFVPALMHLPNLYGVAGDTAAVRRTLEHLLEVDSTGEYVDGIRWYAAMRLGDSVQVQELRGRFDRFSRASSGHLWVSALDENLGLSDARRIVDSVGDHSLSQADRQQAAFRRAMFALDAGRPSEALRLGRKAPFTPVLRVQAALAWDGDSADGANAVRQLGTPDIPPPAASKDRVNYAVELFTLAQYHLGFGRPSVARRVTSRLAKLPVPQDSMWLNRTPQTLTWILEAQLASWDHYATAATLLARADSALQSDAEGTRIDALGNLVVARLWEANGDVPRALAAVRRRIYGLGYPPFLATMLREEGRLAELAGDRTGAIEAYTRYLALRSDPEPSLQPEVERVRAELARLVGEKPEL